MQKKFVTNLAFLLFLNLLVKPFWILGIDRAVQNEVGAAEYGFYFALFNFSFLLNILLDVGITNFNNRNIAQHNHLLQKHLSGILALRLILATTYIVINLIVAWFTGYLSEHPWMLIVLLINQALISLILYLRSNIAGLHLFRIDSIISVLDRFIMITLCAILLWGGITDKPFRIEWFLWSQTFAYSLTALFTLLILGSRVKRLTIKWDPRFSLIILKQSYPFAILILLMTFYNRIDPVILERMLPDGDVQSGIYAQAFRLLDSSNMIAYLFSGLLLPMFSQMIKQKKPLEELVELSFSFIAVPAIMVIAAGIFFSHELMGLMYVSHIEETATVFTILINSFLAISSVYIFGTLLTANGNLKVLNIIALCGMLLNIVLNLLLIPRFKAVGAALASMITQYLTAGAQIYLAHLVFGFRLRWFLAARYAIFIFLTLSLFWFFSSFTGFFLWRAILAALSCFLIALLLKLIRPLELFKVIKYGEN